MFWDPSLALERTPPASIVSFPSLFYMQPSHKGPGLFTPGREVCNSAILTVRKYWVNNLGERFLCKSGDYCVSSPSGQVDLVTMEHRGSPPLMQVPRKNGSGWLPSSVPRKAKDEGSLSRCCVNARLI